MKGTRENRGSGMTKLIKGQTFYWVMLKQWSNNNHKLEVTDYIEQWKYKLWNKDESKQIRQNLQYFVWKRER